MGNQTLTGSFLKSQFNESTLSTTNAEIVLDGGINLLNACGADLDNLTGSAGSKTGTYTSAEAGAIMAVALQIYRENFLNAKGTTENIGPANITSPSSQLLIFAEKMAVQLQRAAASADPPIYISNDPVPTE